MVSTVLPSGLAALSAASTNATAFRTATSAYSVRNACGMILLSASCVAFNAVVLVAAADSVATRKLGMTLVIRACKSAAAISCAGSRTVQAAGMTIAAMSACFVATMRWTTTGADARYAALHVHRVTQE